MEETTKDILKDVFKKRVSGSIKYDFGLLLIIGGSDFYSGSPALSAMAAFRTGVDMVRILAPKRAADIIASFSPNLASYPLKGNRISAEHLTTLITMTKGANKAARGNAAVLIGGGLGRSEEIQEVICQYLSQIQIPAIIDADAIYAVAKKPEILKDKNFLFTPHGYEFFILTDKEVINKSDEEKIKIVQTEAERLKTTILLKGKTDIISDGKQVSINKTGSPYMTVGGTGDVLAGIVGALMARKISPFLAAQAGAFINGRVGEIVAEKKKDGLLATDIIEAIPEILD